MQQNGPPLRVLIADDHPVVRTGLCMAMREDTSLHVVAEVGDGEAAIREIANLQPDVAILDIGMPKVNGIAATRLIRQHNSSVGLIMLTAQVGEDLFRRAMDAGANGYLLKDSALLEITTAIHLVCEGRRYVSSSIAEAAVRGNAGNPEVKLTPIEEKILRLVVSGISSRDIAGKLGLSLRTIENKRSAICDKLGVGGAHALLKWGLEHKQDLA